MRLTHIEKRYHSSIRGIYNAHTFFLWGISPSMGGILILLTPHRWVDPLLKILKGVTPGALY